MEADVKFNLADSEGHLIESLDNTGFNAEYAEYLEGFTVDADIDAIKQAAADQGGTYDKTTSGDFDWHPILHMDVCVDAKIYFILRLELEQTSYVCKWLENAVKLSWEICGSKNAKLINIHWDTGKGFQFGYPGHKVSCALQYVPFDSIIPENTEPADETEAEIAYLDSLDGIVLSISEFSTSLQVGKHYYIQLSDIPKGYKASELICSSLDKSVASVSRNGVVYGVSEGTAVITAMNSDGVTKGSCTVTVTKASSDMQKDDESAGTNGDSANMADDYAYTDIADSDAADIAVGATYTINGNKVKVLSSTSRTAAFIKAKNSKSVSVPATVTIKGKTFKVVQVNAGAFKGKKIRKITIGKNVKVIRKNAFKGSKATGLILKTKLLKASGVKDSLKSSKIKTIQVKVSSKKSVNKTYVKKYKSIFRKANSGKNATVK